MNPISAQARSGLLDALTKGVTPAEFSHLLHIGRAREFLPLRDDLCRLAEGGSSFRIITGASGSGKTHKLHVCEQIALAQGLAVARIEMSPKFRFHGGDGGAQALISAIAASLRFKDVARGQGLQHLLDRTRERIGQNGEVPQEHLVEQVRKCLGDLQHLRLGDSLMDIVAVYLGRNGSTLIAAKATRWLRAEYDSIHAAKRDLGVSAIVEDADFLDYLQLLAGFCRACGYRGLLVLVDEMAILTQNLHGPARQTNFDVILNALNRSCQGASPGLGLVLAGTPDFIDHPHRGLLSYESFRTRLAPSGIEARNVSSISDGPILRVIPLRKEELLLLLRKVRDLVFPPEQGQHKIPDTALESLLRSKLGRLGAEEHLSPREVLKDFAALAMALDRNPERNWQEIISGKTTPTTDSAINPKTSPESDSNSLSDLRL